MGSSLRHVAILASPGSGHLIPVAVLAKRLVARHGFTVTLITYSNFPTTDLSDLPFSVLSLPCVPLDDLPPTAKPETRINVLATRSIPNIRAALHTLSPLSALVADIFGADALATAKEMGIPAFLFCTSTFMFLYSLFRLPSLDAETAPLEYRDLPLVHLPGCVPLRGADLVEPVQDRSDEAYRWIVHMGKRYLEADGVLVNSFVDMEPDAVAAAPAQHRWPPVYPVGPLVRTVRAGKDGDSCLKWLDAQPAGSVVYVSFGSGGRLTRAQMGELAAGLEMSGQRFLWVVSEPSDSGGSFLGRRRSAGEEVLGYLPEGFVSRTEAIGRVVASWAPQVEVLVHGATGGFVSHCGWNSTLESLVNGVPMVAWPIYAEQRMNAVMLTESAGVALRPAGGDGVVGREEIATVVRELMEGERGAAARRRAGELRDAAAEAVGDEGSSGKALAEAVAQWKLALEAHVAGLPG